MWNIMAVDRQAAAPGKHAYLFLPLILIYIKFTFFQPHSESFTTMNLLTFSF